MNKDNELDLMESDLENLKFKIENKKRSLIFDKTGLQESEIIIGEWSCDKSPIDICVYDRIEDPACDYCVFCHQPDERK